LLTGVILEIVAVRKPREACEVVENPKVKRTSLFCREALERIGNALGV